MSYINKAVEESVAFVNEKLVGKTIAGAEMADTGTPVEAMRLRFDDGSKCLIMSEHDEGWIFTHEGGAAGDG